MTAQALELDVERIHAHAEAVGVTGRRFTQLVGVSLDDLSRLTRRTVSLHLLARLSAALDLPIPDLLTSATTPAPPPAPADADLLTSVLLAYGDADTDDLGTALGWDQARLTAAAEAAEARLVTTPIRLVRTDQHLILAARSGLPPPARARIEAAAHRRAALTADDASTLVLLVHHEILEPAAGFRESGSRYRLQNAVDRGLAIDFVPDPRNDLAATARPHPDLMFALRLTATPDQGLPTQ